MTDEGAWDMDPTYNQFSLTGVALKAGDTFVFYNNETGDTWGSVTVDPASIASITGSGTDFSVSEDGCYSVYLKLKFQADNVYFGEGTGCNSTDIIEAETVNMTIYPNPTSDFITINCDEVIDEIVINAINGSEVIRTKSNEVDLSALTPSIYFVNVMLQNGDVVRSKVIRK
jgi:hypothetical protein